MRTTALIAMSALMLVLAAGCGQTSAPTTEPPKQMSFTFIARWAKGDVEAGAQKAAEADGAATVTVVERSTSADQVAELKRLAASGSCDGIAIDCVPSAEVAQAISDCVKAGVPVVTYYSDCLGADPAAALAAGAPVTAMTRNTFVGCPLDEVGEMLAATLHTDMGGSGIVGVIGVPGEQFPTLKAIEDAAVAMLSDVPGLTVLDPVHPAVETGAVSAAIKDVIRQEPSVSGWLILNPAAVPDANAEPLVELADADITMLGMQETTLDAMLANRLDTLVLMPMVEYGSAATKVLIGMARNHSIYPSIVRIGPATAADELNRVAEAQEIKDYLQKIREGEISAHVIPSGAPPLPESASAAAPQQP